MKDLGVVRHILGCEAKHEEETRTSYLTQFQYTKKAMRSSLALISNHVKLLQMLTLY